MTRRADRFYSGQRVRGLAPALNRLVDGVNAQRRGSTPSPIRAAAAIPLEIKTLNADTLTCVDVGAGATPGVREYTVKVPLTFTEAARDGVAYVYTDINTRTADGTENQKLTPIYIVGDVVWCAWSPTGDGALTDLNIDGRQWAKVS